MKLKTFNKNGNKIQIVLEKIKNENKMNNYSE